MDVSTVTSALEALTNPARSSSSPLQANVEKPLDSVQGARSCSDGEQQSTHLPTHPSTAKPPEEKPQPSQRQADTHAPQYHPPPPIYKAPQQFPTRSAGMPNDSPS